MLCGVFAKELLGRIAVPGKSARPDCSSQPAFFLCHAGLCNCSCDSVDVSLCCLMAIDCVVQDWLLQVPEVPFGGQFRF